MMLFPPLKMNELSDCCIDETFPPRVPSLSINGSKIDTKELGRLLFVVVGELEISREL